MTKEEAMDCLAIIYERSRKGARAYHNKYQDAFDMAIEALNGQQWIPCGKRLPKNRDMVLVTVKETLHGDAGCHVEEAYYCEEIWLDVNAIDIEGTSNDVDTFEIIAWMPLPEPYTEEST